MPDAKEWEKVARNIVKTRNWLYKILEDDTIGAYDRERIFLIRYLLEKAIIEIDYLARRDDEGWL